MTTFFNMQVEIVEYDSNWKILFEQEVKALSEQFGDKVWEYEHFGSTSVPGMRAKPIIDIQAVTASLPLSTELRAILELRGYEIHPQPENILESRYCRFNRGNPKVTHILHLRTSRSVNPIRFREFMTQSPEARQIYSDAKSLILSSPDVSMIKYRDDKQAVLADLQLACHNWIQLRISLGLDVDFLP